jgi:ABC-type glycerol-3-phosphate transport system substrate-binding protein
MLKRFIVPASISLSILAGLAACGSSDNTTTPGSDTSVPGVVTTTAAMTPTTTA